MEWATESVNRITKLFYLFQILQVPLHHAAEYGHLACLEALLRQGADVNSKTAEGWTAMHSAALYGRTSCVEALIRYLFARPLTGVLTFVIVTISPIVNCRWHVPKAVSKAFHFAFVKDSNGSGFKDWNYKPFL